MDWEDLSAYDEEDEEEEEDLEDEDEDEDLDEEDEDLDEEDEEEEEDEDDEDDEDEDEDEEDGGDEAEGEDEGDEVMAGLNPAEIDAAGALIERLRLGYAAAIRAEADDQHGPGIGVERLNQRLGFHDRRMNRGS